jgi:hypothetical protein
MNARGRAAQDQHMVGFRPRAGVQDAGRGDLEPRGRCPCLLAQHEMILARGVPVRVDRDPVPAADGPPLFSLPV